MNQDLCCGSFRSAAAAWRPSDALSALVYLRQVPCAAAAAALEVIKNRAPCTSTAL